MVNKVFTKPLTLPSFGKGVGSRSLLRWKRHISLNLLQTSGKRGKIHIRDSLASVWKKEGIQGLFAGNLTNVLRIFPTSAMVCLVYSRMIKVGVVL